MSLIHLPLPPNPLAASKGTCPTSHRKNKESEHELVNQVKQYYLEVEKHADIKFSIPGTYSELKNVTISIPISYTIIERLRGSRYIIDCWWLRKIEISFRQDPNTDIKDVRSLKSITNKIGRLIFSELRLQADMVQNHKCKRMDRRAGQNSCYHYAGIDDVICRFDISSGVNSWEVGLPYGFYEAIDWDTFTLSRRLEVKHLRRIRSISELWQ